MNTSITKKKFALAESKMFDLLSLANQVRDVRNLFLFKQNPVILN